MRNSVVRVAVALVLAAGAWAMWHEARILDDVAGRRLGLALLQYDLAASSQSEWLPSDMVVAPADSVSGALRRDAATAHYWLGHYQEASTIDRQEIDPGLLLVAANSAYRVSEREGLTGDAGVQRLDGVMQAYASVLKAAPDNADAAYNFEYVARLRDSIARAAHDHTKTAGRVAAGAPSTSTSDLPDGPTVHGRPGAPPPDVKAEDFKVIAPMEFGDREAQPEPTPGGKLPRKG